MADLKFDPNNLFYKMLETYVRNKDNIDPRTINERYPKGRKTLVKFFNQGSSRSSKTYDEIHLIFKFIDYFATKGRSLQIDVYRDTLVSCRDNTFKDFKECISKYISLSKDKKGNLIPLIDECKVTEYPKPNIEWKGSNITFKGLPEAGKQASRCDISFINEIMETQNRAGVESVFMRTELFAMADWNPSLTDHFAFGYKEHYNCFFSQTTYLDNKHLPDSVISQIESTCPWDFNDFDFTNRVWKRPECKDGEVYDENIHRRPNLKNKEAGTIDKWWWLVYGEGIPTAREGAIFPNVEWIAKFPDTGISTVNFSIDFGFSNDPTCLVRAGMVNKKLYAECLSYQNTPTPEILIDLIRKPILNEVVRRWVESGREFANEEEMLAIEPIIIVCDSSDRYKESHFVRDLNNLAIQKGYMWQFVKIQKPSIVTRINKMLQFDMNIVSHDKVKLEQQNYIYLLDRDGKPTNMPDPDSKFCHFWDSLGYLVWYFYRWV